MWYTKYMTQTSTATQTRQWNHLGAGDTFRWADRDYLMTERDSNGHVHTIAVKTGQPKFFAYGLYITVEVELIDSPCKTCGYEGTVPSKTSWNGITLCPTCRPDALRDLIEL